MDAVLQALGEAIRESESRPSLLKADRVAQIRKDYLLLSQMGKETDAKVTWGLHTPFVSMGNITLEADDLIFLDPVKLAEVISRCDNIEVYPPTKGVRTFSWTCYS